MKKQLLALASLLLSISAFAQNGMDLVIFSEDGDLFYAYVNGIRQNDSPQPNVKITGLTSPNVALRIEFNDKSLPQLKQNMALEMGYEHTAKIKRDMKKQLKLRYFGQAPLNTTGNAGVSTVAYHSTENTNYNVASGSGAGNGTSVSGTTVTSTSVTNTLNPAGVNININGMGVNMSVTGMDADAGTMNTVTSTTVTTTSSSSSSSSSSMNSSENAPAPPAGQTKNAGCRNPMNAGDFGNLKKSVEAKPFSDTKMSTARLATKNACLSAAQIGEVCQLFSMDEDKLAYAKFAYDYCVDKANYYQIGEVFSFSTTNDELNQFLETK